MDALASSVTQLFHPSSLSERRFTDFHLFWRSSVVILQHSVAQHEPLSVLRLSLLRPRRVFLSAGSPIGPEVREEGSVFAPKFDGNGLLSAVVLDSHSKEVLVVAFMNAEALAKTRETGKVTFWSRSRGKLWMKGETSGHVLNVVEILVDCDQDALVIYADPAGPTCHTGRKSCFYRRLDLQADDPKALVKVNT
jgi:phosphoribosyl-AMP cyclohydrolase